MGDSILMRNMAKAYLEAYNEELIESTLPGPETLDKEAPTYAKTLDEYLIKTMCMHATLHISTILLNSLFNTSQLSASTMKELQEISTNNTPVLLFNHLDQISESAKQELKKIMDSEEENPYLTSMKRLHDDIVAKETSYQKAITELTKVTKIIDKSSTKVYFAVVRENDIYVHEYDKDINQLRDLGLRDDLTEAKLSNKEWRESKLPSAETYLVTNPCNGLPAPIMTIFALDSLEYLTENTHLGELQDSANSYDIPMHR